MDQDLTSESVSGTRQKSCNACVKAKRACDKRHPVCSRCVEKKTACIYAKRPHSEAFPTDFDFGSIQVDNWADFDAPSSTGFLDTAATSPDHAPPFLDVSTNLDQDGSPNPFSGFTESLAGDSLNMQLMFGMDRPLDQPKEVAPVLNTFSYADMTDICVCISCLAHSILWLLTGN